jgi:phosphatidylinositol alpha-mannosyltransferase
LGRVSTPSLRIGLVYDDTIDRHGGIGLYVTTLGAALMRRGHYVEYLVGASSSAQVGGAPVHSLARNVGVRFNGNALSMPAWSNGQRLDRILGAGDYDVLHVQVPYSPLMAGRLLTRAGPRCAAIGTYHVASERLPARVGARLLWAMKFRSAPRFDETVSVSRVAADFAARWSGIRAGRIVPNMLDLAGVRALAGRSPGEIEADVVFVGRLVPRKGAEELIAAVACLKRRPAQARTKVAIIGEGPLRGRLERRARRLGVSGSVSFHGAVDEVAKIAALKQARVACFPSLFGESFGVVILEALAAGAGAVVAGENPGYAELLEDRRALVDPRDPEALAARLQAFLEDERLRRDVGGGQRRLLSRYDADSVTGEVLAVYEAALRGRGVRAVPRGREGPLRVAA